MSSSTSGGSTGSGGGLGNIFGSFGNLFSGGSGSGAGGQGGGLFGPVTQIAGNFPFLGDVVNAIVQLGQNVPVFGNTFFGSPTSSSTSTGSSTAIGSSSARSARMLQRRQQFFEGMQALAAHEIETSGTNNVAKFFQQLNIDLNGRALPTPPVAGTSPVITSQPLVASGTKTTATRVLPDTVWPIPGSKTARTVVPPVLIGTKNTGTRSAVSQPLIPSASKTSNTRSIVGPWAETKTSGTRSLANTGTVYVGQPLLAPAGTRSGTKQGRYRRYAYESSEQSVQEQGAQLRRMVDRHQQQRDATIGGNDGFYYATGPEPNFFAPAPLLANGHYAHLN